jgi:iron complex outermembrane receptor protein
MKTIQKKLFILLFILPFSIFAQSTIKGTVLDNFGQGLPGVSVVVKGTSNGVATDFDGNFTLSNIKKGDVISFSFIGSVTQELVYNNQKEVTITLIEDALQLADVVVIGYGTAKKKDLTGAVATLSAKDFNQGSVVTVENLLNGKVAGLSINTSGAPGSGSEIRIRGGSSLSASNDPLIVIDGLPISNDNGVGSTSILASINPNDIESFTVLKDASATAIYGSRASNGVIIITTKKGGKELSVDYNFQYGSGRAFNQIDVFDANAYRDLINRVGTPVQISKLGDASTNWQDEIYRRTDFVDNNISLRGNLFNRIPARFSFGNTYQEGLRLTNKFNRNSYSMSLNPEFFDKHLKINVNANYTNQQNRFADGVEGAAIRFDPTQPVYDASLPGGFFEYITGYNANGAAIYANPSIANPVAQLLQTNDRGINNRLFGNFQLDYKFHFLPELRAVVNLGYDKQDGERLRNRPSIARSGFLNNNISNGSIFNESNERLNQSLDSYFIYNKKFGELDFEGTAGYSYQRFENEGLTGVDFANPQSFQIPYIDEDVVLIGFIGRANFNLKEKYLLTLSYRRDGTSRFGEDNRWGNFPAAAFAWRLNEDLFKESKVVSDLKLRLGWGLTGQQEINNRLFFRQLYDIGNPNSQYTFGNQSVNVGLPSAFGPLRWEETATYNAGIDFGIAKNRLTGALDVFYKKSTDLFQNQAPFADGSNFSNSGPQNIGDMSIKGFEASLDYALFKNENFKWNININATKFERRIDRIGQGVPVFTGGTGSGGTGGTSQILAEGFTPNSFFVYKQLYDPQGNAIEGAFADLNGDNIINGQDRYIYKNPDPDLLLGFSTNLNYKSFDFGFNLRASIGNRVLNTINSSGSYYSQIANGELQNVPTNILSTNFQVQNGENVLSDMFIENASFLRMDYATLGYTFKKWLDGKATLRLFTGVQNPFVITKYSGLDPELTGGVDQTIYPRQRQFLFGANVKF